MQSGAIFEDVTHPEEGSDNDGNDFVEYEVKAILAERTKNGIHERCYMDNCRRCEC